MDYLLVPIQHNSNDSNLVIVDSASQSFLFRLRVLQQAVEFHVLFTFGQLGIHFAEKSCCSWFHNDGCRGLVSGVTKVAKLTFYKVLFFGLGLISLVSPGMLWGRLCFLVVLCKFFQKD